MNKQFDVLVIGAGIAGITAGVYLKRANLSSLILDKGAPGGKLLNIHRIDNYPGVASIPGPELAMKLYQQASELGVEFGYGSVQSLQKGGDLFRVDTEDETYYAKAVIVATGVTNKKLGVPGEKEFLGRGVSYCATCDGNFFKGKEVVVVGNKDHAVEDVLYLSGVVSKVHFVMPEELETTAEHEQALHKMGNILFYPKTKVDAIEGDGRVEKVLLSDGTALPVSAIFPLYGEKSSLAFLSSLEVKNENGFLEVNQDMETSIPGLFACGDILAKKLRQLVNAAGEASVAATSAISYVKRKA